MKHILASILKVFLILIGLVGIGTFLILALRPWYMKMGSTESERSQTLPGDELVPNPVTIRQTGIAIQAGPGKIFPWLVQLGAEMGGFYSYSILENMVGCKITNASVIHPEWQNRQVGDLVKMCPGASGPPPYQIAAINPGSSFILGHQEKDGSYADTWQFVLIPIDQHNTRLVIRSRSTLSGGLWTVVDPISVLMEQGMLRGIRSRAEGS